MTKYCITAANRNSTKDDRVSELKLWEHKQNDQKKWEWHLLGKKTLNFVAALLADGHEVISGKEVKNDKGKITNITSGAAIEIELRIAKNDEKFKITDLPEF